VEANCDEGQRQRLTVVKVSQSSVEGSGGLMDGEELRGRRGFERGRDRAERGRSRSSRGGSGWPIGSWRSGEGSGGLVDGEEELRGRRGFESD
jgi:hypothetical protein